MWISLFLIFASSFHRIWYALLPYRIYFSSKMWMLTKNRWPCSYIHGRFSDSRLFFLCSMYYAGNRIIEWNVIEFKTTNGLTKIYIGFRLPVYMMLKWFDFRIIEPFNMHVFEQNYIIVRTIIIIIITILWIFVK